MAERLDKLVASLPGITRSEAKKIIQGGRVSVNGKIVKSPKEQFPEEQELVIDGNPFRFKRHLYILQNKPLGVISSTDDKTAPTVLDILPKELRRDGLFPAGRLDKYSEGMMLITDDGELAHRILSPKHHIPKTYYVEVDHPIMTKELQELFGKGVYLGDGEYSSPAILEILSPTEGNITIFEGIYHQVRRMFDQNGGKVTRLKRIAMGGLPLDQSLPAGESRELTEQELLLLSSTDKATE